MKAFVTGGTGFIGGRVVHKLLERGYEVAALARNQRGADILRAAGAAPALGDLTDAQAVRQAMQGADMVFHIGGWYKIGDTDERAAERTNIEGTRTVLEAARELGVRKIVYVSTVMVYGDTHGALVDENYPIPVVENALTPYDRTKREAHVRVVQPMAAAGVPIITALPGIAYGPGDPSLTGQLMRLYLKGLLPVLPGPESAYTFAYVDDIAQGIVLAAEKGRPGEEYILAGPALRLDEFIRAVSEASGKPYPRGTLSTGVLKPLAPLAQTLSRVLPLPPVFSADTLRLLGATWTARADKARLELGWEPRPLEEGLRETIAGMAEMEPPAGPQDMRRRQAAALALAAGLGVLLVWLVSTRRRK